MEQPTTLEVWVRWLTFFPIFVCSIVGMKITIDKWLDLRRPTLPDVLKLAAVRRLVEAGARDAATDASRGAPLLAAAAGAAGSPRELVKERLGVAGSAAAAEVEAGLGSLALLAALGPLFGLLGTVVGIVLVFNRLAAAGGVASPAELAGGIGTALYTTIAGLVVGILALVFQRYFASRADRAVAQLEAFALFLVELVEGDGT